MRDFEGVSRSGLYWRVVSHSNSPWQKFVFVFSKTAKDYSLVITHLEIGFFDEKNWWTDTQGLGDNISIFFQ